MSGNFRRQKISRLYEGPPSPPNQMKQLHEQSDQQLNTSPRPTQKCTWASEEESDPKGNVQNPLGINHFATSYTRLGTCTDGLPQSTYKETMHMAPRQHIEPKRKTILNEEAIFRYFCPKRNVSPLLSPSFPDQQDHRFQTMYRADFNPGTPSSQNQRETNQTSLGDSRDYRKRKSMFYRNAENHVTGQDTWADETCSCSICTSRLQPPLLRQSGLTRELRPHIPGPRR